MKKRILFVSEASFLSTGYSTYTLEVMKRLNATGKYELAEFASYGESNDPRSFDLPWGYYPVMPDRNDEAAVEQYERGKPFSQWGAGKFEEVALRFKVDACIGIRDPWMDKFLQDSPLRPHYHFSYMPTVDAEPQKDEWLALMLGADSVFAYTDWGLGVVKEQTQGRAKTVCAAPPGADTDSLKPVADRRLHRQKMGVDPEALIVGTVMRNQARKLYPDLVASFARYLKQAPPSLSSRTYLYLHTGWPDLSWDLPKLIKQFGVGHKTLFTYICRSCNSAFTAFFSDARTFCRKCGKSAAFLTNSNAGVSRQTLCEIYNLFDVYVQLSNSEGIGMPQVEASACEIPLMAVDYSGMHDVVEKVGGVPIKVAGFDIERETHCKRARPDSEDFVRKLIELLGKPEPVRRRMGRHARLMVQKHYNYDKTAQIWERHLDSIPVRDTWSSPAHLHTPSQSCPPNLSDEEFVRWGFIHVAGRPDLVGSYASVVMTRDLMYGATLELSANPFFSDMSLPGVKTRHKQFTREDAFKRLVEMCHHRNFWERKRAEVCGS